MSPKLGLAVAFSLIAFPAMAADPRFEQDFAQPAWDGVYGGLFASHDITSLHVKADGLLDFNGIGGESQFAGVLLGFNHRFSERIVGGAEADAALSGGDSHFNISDSGDFFNSSISGDWGVSAKARIGYLVAPGTLLYTYVGGLVAQASYGCTSNVVECPARVQKTLYGWPFIGFGAETQIWNDWRFRLEYEAKLLPTLSFGGSPSLDVTPLSGTAKVALIHDFGPQDAKSESYPAFGYAPNTWTGFHGGAAGGYSMSVTSMDATVDPYTASFDGFGGGGFTGGFFGGYDQQFGNFVVGIDGGYYWNGGRLRYTVNNTGEITATGSSFYTVRGRAGVIVNPSTMIYAVGGWIHADGSVDVFDGSGALIGSQPLSRQGPEFGGGIEMWVNRHFSIRAEYTYDVFENGIPDTGEPIQFRSRVGTAMLGAVLHFGEN